LTIRCPPDLQAPSKAVFVTGATGFIGQRLVTSLVAQGQRVQAMVRPEKQPDSRIPDGCEQIPVSLTDVDSLTGILAGSSAVIYCVGSVRGRKGADFAMANIAGVKAILDALERSGRAPPLLLLSSLAASRPELSDYARSKYEGEKLLLNNSTLPWTIFRPPAVYGPGDREMLPILKLIRRGLLAHAGPLDQRLSLLHVDDLVDACVTWLSMPQRCLHQTYSIDDGTPGGYSWATIGEAVGQGKLRVLKLPRFLLESTARVNLLLSRILNYAPMLSPGKVRELIQPEWLGDNSDFTAATGWEPSLDLSRGAQQLFESNSK
jgi:nucleoside-diphosphate-sugar epimerase